VRLISDAALILPVHRWSLGENNMWQKMTNFELGVRVPLIMRAPWLPKSVGAVTHALVEAVDLFPTFTVMAGLQEAAPLPPDQLLQGSSLANVLADPNDRSHWKQYAFSQFAKAMQHSSELNQSVPWNVCVTCNRTTIHFMGFSVRGDNYRYTEWFGWDQINEVPLWNITEGVELYNHTRDYGQDFDLSTPTQNLAHMPNLRLLQARFRAALLKQFQGDHEPPQRGAE
jgi:iduronate 2-sulfatase